MKQELERARRCRQDLDGVFGGLGLGTLAHLAGGPPAVLLLILAMIARVNYLMRRTTQ